MAGEKGHGRGRKALATLASLLLALCTAWPPGAFADQDLDAADQARDSVQESVDIRQKTQKEREEWQEERQELTARYDQLEQENQDLAQQRKILEKKVQSAQGQVKDKEEKLADMEQVTQDIEPFLQDVVADLSRRIKEGIPFLHKEREKRLHQLHDLLQDPDKPVSEKYRRIMEGLLVEAEYGRPIEIYRKNIDIQGRKLRATILRLGRLNLFYQSMDQKECGWFNVAQNQWEELPDRYSQAVGTAIDIGRERHPVELLIMPMGRLEVQ
jgi:DNA repair exonuclease SbcCD ATPase subunit